MTARALLVPLLSALVGAAGPLLWSAARGQVPPASMHEALAPFAPLVGVDWEAELPGGSLVDHQRFEWVFDGRFLRNVHAVKNPAGETIYAGEALYAWNARDGELVWWYWNTTGGYLVGTAREEDGRILADGENFASGEQTPRVRSVFELDDAGWRSHSFFERGGEWVPQGDTVFRPAD